MEIKSNVSILCWNIGNPSEERAIKQSSWLRNRPEDIFVLTETKNSKGCLLLQKFFSAYGYQVICPIPEGKEYGSMIISRLPLNNSNFSKLINYLPSRVVSATLSYQDNDIEIIGVYVPSRDASDNKINKKKTFLGNLLKAFTISKNQTKRIFCGDFNILEPNHIPNYAFFKEWEYDFYDSLEKYQLGDAFRHMNGSAIEYSWIGRTGDGYRYDHCFVSNDLLPHVDKCCYLHEPREIRLSDHSAIITEINL